MSIVRGAEHPSSVWTQAHRDMVAEMLSAGKTSREIAEKFPGKSRNAIIGLVIRDERLKAIGFQSRAKGVNRLRRTRRTVVSPTPSIAHEALDDMQVFAAHTVGLPLAMLERQHCRWCINDPEPRTAGHLFCAQVVAPRSRYCEHHAARAVQVGAR